MISSEEILKVFEELVADTEPVSRDSSLKSIMVGKPALSLTVRERLRARTGITIEQAVWDRFETVGSVIAYLQRQQSKPLPTGLRWQDYLSPATSLLNHYSAVRASVVPALITAALGFMTYLLTFLADNSDKMTADTWAIASTLAVGQLFLLFAAALTNQRLSNLHKTTRDFLVALEGTHPDKATDLFGRLSSPSITRGRPHDWWDWLVLIFTVGLALAMCIAFGAYVVQ